jgi:hypothetical protein
MNPKNNGLGQSKKKSYSTWNKAAELFNPLNGKLNPICHLLALLGAHPILHVSRVRVNEQRHTDMAEGAIYFKKYYTTYKDKTSIIYIILNV